MSSAGVMKRDLSWKALVAVGSDFHNTAQFGKIANSCAPSPQPSGASACSEHLDVSRLDPAGATECKPASKRRRTANWNRATDQQVEGIGTSGEDEPDDPAPLDRTRIWREENEACSQNQSACSWDVGQKADRKPRMIWTSELHRRFVNAVNHLGMKNAVPKTILRMMNVEGVSRENVASHLQKYRQHLKKTAENGMCCPMPNVVGASTKSPAAEASAVSSSKAATVCGVPMQSARNLTSEGLLPVIGLPVDASAPQAGLSAAEVLKKLLAKSNIPAQAWAAGVPGYDALQGVQMLSAQKHGNVMMKSEPLTSLAPLGHEGFASFTCGAEALAAPPVLNIAPLLTAYQPADCPGVPAIQTSIPETLKEGLAGLGKESKSNLET